MNATSNFLNLLKTYTYFPGRIEQLGKWWLRLVNLGMTEGRGFRKRSSKTPPPQTNRVQAARWAKESQKRKRARKVRKWNQRNQVRYHG